MKGDIERKDVLYSPVQNGETDEKMVLTTQPVVAVINLSNGGAKGPTLEKKKRFLRTQLLACGLVQLIQILVGIAMGNTSSLIPQLEADGSSIPLTRDMSAWVASILTISVPIGSALSGWVVTALGRLNTVKLVMVPIGASWAVIATAQSFEQVLVGRIILGASFGMGLNAAVLFTTEVAEKEIRGVLTCLGVAFASLGILCSYIIGAFLPWRVTAWVFCAPPCVVLALLFLFSEESPVWLRGKGKEQAARKASLYFYKDPDKVLSTSHNTDGHSEISLSQMVVKLFTTAAGLKPFVIINIMFMFQQLVGLYITVYYAVTFFQETGSELDPYLATILIGVLRVVLCTGTSVTAGRLGRRPLMIFSSISMGSCMLASAIATQRILGLQQAKEIPPGWLSWLVVVSILLYVAFGSMGLQILPWSMMAEMFPHEVRPVAQPINLATAHIYMFAFLQLYPTLSYWLGGSVGLQFLFAAMSYIAALFVWVFMVETRGRTLEEIEDYFRNNTIHLGHKRRAQKRSLKITASPAGA